MNSELLRCVNCGTEILERGGKHFGNTAGESVTPKTNYRNIDVCLKFEGMKMKTRISGKVAPLEIKAPTQFVSLATPVCEICLHLLLRDGATTDSFVGKVIKRNQHYKSGLEYLFGDPNVEISLRGLTDLTDVLVEERVLPQSVLSATYGGSRCP